MATTFINRAFILVTCIGFIAIGVWQSHAILTTSPIDPIYGPNSIIFALLVLAQSILQVSWLWTLYFRRSEHVLLWDKVRGEEDGAETESHNAALIFSPILVMEYICLIAWNCSWQKGKFLQCEIIVILNTVIHLFAVYWLFPQAFVSASKVTARTHLLSRTSTGIAFLYMWKTWGVIDEVMAPTISQRLQTGAVFVLLTISSGPEPTLGLCFLCDLIVIILGPCQVPQWRKTFIYISMAVVVVVAWDYFLNGRKKGAMLKDSNGELEEQSYSLVDFSVSL